MHIIKEFNEHGLETHIGYLDPEKKTIILSLNGVLDMLSTEVVFVTYRPFLNEWFENRKETELAVFDLYHLTHINSFAIGHLTQFYLVLFKRKLPVTLIVNPESTSYQILDYCGLFELHGLHVQTKPLEEGLET